MRAKVLCAVLVYNGETYKEGNYIEVRNDAEMQMLIGERSAVEIKEKKVMAQPNSTNIKSQGGVRRK